jgi:hypothetical protein
MEPRATTIRDVSAEPHTSPAGDADASFVEALMDTELYSMGAFFSDQHPELVDEVVERSGRIEAGGLRAYAEDSGTDVEEAFGLLLTGLAVRYYKAVNG